MTGSFRTKWISAPVAKVGGVLNGLVMMVGDLANARDNGGCKLWPLGHDVGGLGLDIAVANAT